MSETRVFEDRKRYRVWSLTGQGYLNLTTKDGASPSVDCSGTGNELSSIITARDIKKHKGPAMMGFWLDIQEDRQDGKKYTLDTANGVVSAKEKSLPDPEETGIFYVDHFGCETPGKGSLFKALMPLGSNNETKCIALNSEKKFSLETFDKYSPHPDTIFLITKVD